MDNKKIEVKSKQTILTTPSFLVEERLLEIAQIGEITRHVVVHHGAVVILPITQSQEIVFVRQYRHAVDQWLLELPAGTLENAEHPSSCAERELSEETGFGASHWRELGVIYPAPGFCSEQQYLFLARELFVRKLEADQDEIIEVVKIPLADLRQTMLAGHICDAKSLALILRATLLGEISF